MESKNILLVEDDFLNRRLCKKVLTEHGYHVVEAKNADEAIAALTAMSIHLVVLDINLGEGEQDGISLGAHIGSKYKIPFVYLTAYDIPEIMNRAIDTAPVSYLTKPFKNVDLVAMAGAAIRMASAEVKAAPSITVKDGDHNLDLPIADICYISSEGNYIQVHTATQVYMLRSTIKEVLDILPQPQFVQIHRGYVVHKTKIEKYNSKEVVIAGAVLPISKTFIDNL